MGLQMSPYDVILIHHELAELNDDIAAPQLP